MEIFIVMRVGSIDSVYNALEYAIDEINYRLECLNPLSYTMRIETVGDDKIIFVNGSNTEFARICKRTVKTTSIFD